MLPPEDSELKKSLLSQDYDDKKHSELEEEKDDYVQPRVFSSLSYRENQENKSQDNSLKREQK